MTYFATINRDFNDCLRNLNDNNDLIKKSSIFHVSEVETFV